MGAVRPRDVQPGRPQPLGDLGLAVDPHVATDRDGGVVVGVECPVHELGSKRRHGHGNGAAGSEHPGQFRRSAAVVRDVLHHLAGDDAVEAFVGEGQPKRVTVHAARGRTGRQRLLQLHGIEGRRGLAEIGDAVVEGDELGPAA